MEKLLDAIMNKLLAGGFVDDENAEIVRFGLELVIMKCLISAAMIVVAIATKSVAEVLLFIVSYALLRGCCGGYHANSRIACIISSLFILSAVISLAKLMEGKTALLTSIGLLGFGTVFVLMFAPVDTPNKPFDMIERVVFRKRALMASFTSLFFSFMLAAFKMYTFSLTVSAAVFFTGLLLIAGRLTNKKGAVT